MSLRPKVEAAAQLLHEIAVQAAGEGEQPLTVRAVLMAEELRGWLEGKRALTKSTVTNKLRGDMEAAHRQKLSEASTANAGKKVHPMLLEARKHGLATMQDLADALGYTKSMLSRIMSGDRTMPEDRAKKFQALTGKPWRS